MCQEHWRTWKCPFGCADRFLASSFLSNHLRTNHGSTMNNSDVHHNSQTNMELIEGACPLCWEYEIKSSRQYQDHVGNHLEQLALFILPGVEEAAEGVDEGEDSEFESDHQGSEGQTSFKTYQDEVEREESSDFEGVGSAFSESEHESQLEDNADKRSAKNWALYQSTKKYPRMELHRSPPPSRGLDKYNRRIADDSLAGNSLAGISLAGIYEPASDRRPRHPTIMNRGLNRRSSQLETPVGPIQQTDPIERPPARMGHRAESLYQEGLPEISQPDELSQTHDDGGPSWEHHDDD